MNAHELIAERLKLNDDSKTLLDVAARERRGLRADEQQTFDRMHVRIMEIKGLLDRGALMAAEERTLGESRGRQTETTTSNAIDSTSDTAGGLALRAWALGNRATDTMVAAAQQLGMNWRQPEIDVRALSYGTTTAGGNLVANEMMSSFREAVKWYGSVRSVATVLTPSTGAPLPVPVGDDTANTGEIVGEGSAVTTTADPVFNQTVLRPFKYSSKAVIVSIELLQDSAINLAQYLGQALGTRIGRIQNLHYSVGAGTTLPFGVATQAALGKTAAATNAITFDEIIDLYHSVDVGYRGRPGAGFMMNDSTAATLRKVKDSQNRYLWEMSLVAGQPDRIFGKPVYINNDLDAATATAKRVVLFGDFKSYVIAEVGGLTILRSDDVRILNHQVVFLGYQRADAALTDATAVRYLRTA